MGIEFRAWDKKWKIMTASVNFKNIQEGFAGLFGEEKEIMQFTGLLDKNGKKIFQGDIIKSDYSEFIYEVVFATKGYFAGAFCLKNLKAEKKYRGFSQKSIWMPSDEPKNFDEVIGNRFENPELLETK
jgi:uncharacterized phage protein (TIGR01671 family)